jgi:alkylation response protein AidB-like acyl-CoA dehydrogenase
MDFDLTDDQVDLRDGARALLDDLASPARVRQHTAGSAARDDALWSAMVEQGWFVLGVPEEHGGLGLGSVESALLFEEIGRHVAPVPFLATALAAGVLGRAGHPSFERLADGSATGCVAWSRGAVRATGDGERVTLDGRPDPVVAAPSADVAVVFAVDAGGDEGLYLVDLGVVGRPPREPAMDLTRELGWLDLAATPAERVGDAAAAAALLDRAATFTAAEMLGAADRVLEMAVDYARERVQFGRPIGSFQAVKHRCADMLVDVEGMRSTVYWAAWELDSGDDPSVAASTAKCWASDASRRVMASGLQVHGGIGFTWEHDLHFFLKRAQLDQVAFGDATFHRARLTSLLRPRVEAGASVV